MTPFKKSILRLTILSLALGMGLSMRTSPAWAVCDVCTPQQACAQNCVQISQQQSEWTIRHLHRETEKTIEHLKQQFTNSRNWMTTNMASNNVIPALMLFAEQMTSTAMYQVMVIGSFLDAKHQLETQRLFQELTAQAHKDYQPSEGMCTFGTNVRSLAASDRNTDLSAIAISHRALQRELLSGSAVAGNGNTSDKLSRLNQFRSLYCNKADNGNGLQNLCQTTSNQASRFNKDINYTATVDTPLTLDMDFTSEGDNPYHGQNRHVTTVSQDEEDVFALAANLYAHDVMPEMAPTTLKSDNNTNPQGVRHYMNLRAIAAKRSVASNSFAAIAAMKSMGEKEVQPYLYALMKEMGVADPEEIKKYLGDRPSYYAQMEMLTKKLYQNPVFYTELYDKPANVSRKMVSMQAIELMQRRDMYRSILRSEAILSVMLETALAEEQDDIENEILPMTDGGPLITLPTP